MGRLTIIVVVITLQSLLSVEGIDIIELSCDAEEYRLKHGYCVLKNKIIKNGTRLEMTWTPGILDRDITTVQFESSEMVTIPEDIFHIFPKFRNLELTNCGITWLKKDVLWNALTLESLSLSSNKLTSLTEPLNSHFVTTLYTLNLERNEIESISEIVFKSLIELQTLHLSYNHLKQLPKDVFKPLINLKRLSLDFNNLVSLDDDLFQFNTKLLYVYLRNNKLHAFSGKLLRNIPLFEYLSLEHNEISHFEIASPIKSTDVDFNRITDLHLPTSLEKFSAENNSISSLSCDDNDSLSLMSTVILTHNNLTNLNCIEKMKNLNKLVLNNNNLFSVNASVFSKLPKLNSLGLRATNITLSARVFTMQYELQYLDVSDNRYNAIDWNAFIGLNELQHLYLDRNNLTQLPVEKIVALMPNIKKITINNNNFKCDDLQDIIHKLDAHSLTYDSSTNPYSNPNSINGILCRSNQTPIVPCPPNTNEMALKDIAERLTNVQQNVNQTLLKQKSLIDDMQTKFIATKSNKGEGASAAITLLSILLVLFIILVISLFVIAHRLKLTPKVPILKRYYPMNEIGSQQCLQE